MDPSPFSSPQSNANCGWLSPVEIDEARDPIGADLESSNRRASRKGAVAISLPRYLQLLDWAGRRVRGNKRGAIAAGLAAILYRIGLTEKSLLASLVSFGSPSNCLEAYLDAESPPGCNVLRSPVNA